MKNTLALLVLLFFVFVEMKAQPPHWVAPGEEIFENPPEDYVAIDFMYNPNVASVQLYPVGVPAAPPIVQLGRNLRLEFDIFGDDAPYFAARIEHCHANWERSGLRPLEFMDQYNEFRLNNFEFSVATKVPFAHYIFDVPPVKISGNFLLVIYDEKNPKVPVITKRFVVYRNQIPITVNFTNMAGINASQTMHQISFKLDYNNLELEQPIRTVKVSLIQNGRWDNAIHELKPLYINAAKKELDYSYFNFENAFLAGNEFRTFEMGNFQAGGVNVKTVHFGKSINQVELLEDVGRAGKGFNTTFQDIDGSFIIGCRTCRQPGTYSDYAEVYFRLKAAQPFDSDLYVTGAFCNWHLLPQNRLFFQPDKQRYEGKAILKQGRYDYSYVLYNGKEQRDDLTVDGSFFQTENTYQVLVYYHPLGTRYGQVIGYTSLQSGVR